MRTRITLSVILGLLTLAFVYKGDINSLIAKKTVEIVPAVSKQVLSESEKQARMEYLLSAKVCKYECESSAGCFSLSETGNNITDNSEYGNGVTVRYCKAGVDKQGYIIKGLVQNTEQSTMSTDKWLNAAEHNWIVHPRLRIDKEEINREGAYKDLFKKVCRLEIVNAVGTVIKEVEIDLRYFMDKFPGDECRIYNNGTYRDNFPAFLMDSVISINGQEINPPERTNTNESMVDYRVYWYGNCDLWVDYVLVENETADDLFKGKYDVWLQSMTNQQEVTLWKIRPQRYDINTLPCIKYIETKMNRYSNGKFAMIY